MKKWMMLLIVTAIVTIRSVPSAYSAIPENIWQLSFDQQLDALVVDLSEQSGPDRLASIEWIVAALNDDQKTEILAGLHKLLDKYASDPAKAYAVLAIIDQYPDVSSVDPLIVLWEKNPGLEEDVAYKISNIHNMAKSDAAYAAMIRLYKEGSHSQFLFKDLVEYATVDKTEDLVGLFKDPSFDGHREILRKLAEIAAPSLVIPLAIDALKDEDVAMRQTASSVLGDLGDKSSIPALKQAQKIEKDIFVKLNMSEQLVRLGEFAYLDEILKVVENSKGKDLTDVRSASFDRLKRLSIQDFGENAEAWRKWFEQETLNRKLK